MTAEELDHLAMVVQGEDNELDGTKTGSEEEGFDSTEKNDAYTTDDGLMGEE